MANPYKGDAAGAHAFLNALGFGGQRSDKTAIDYAGRAERLLSQGKEGFTLSDLRRHSVTPEHPGRRAPDRSQFQQGLTREQRSERPHGGGSLTLPNGGVIISGYTKAVGRTVAGTAQQMQGNIKISYTGKDGKRHELFSKGGLKPKDFKAALAKYGSWQATANYLAGLVYRDDEDAMPADGAEFEFYIE